MKIAVDISQIVYEGSGVARYTQNLVESLLHYDQKNEYIFFFSSLRRSLNKEIENTIKKKQTLKKYPFPPTLLDFIWNKLHIFPIDNLVGNVDLIITSDWTEPPSSTKKITIVHDLVYLTYPKTLPQQIRNVQTRRMNWVKKESALIIADSHSTKHDIIELLKIPDEKIKVIYPAIIHPRGETRFTPQDTQSILSKYKLTTPFILTVGKQEPRKNIPRLISAFQSAKLNNIELVIVGVHGWGDSHKKMNNVRYLGFVTDEELSILYTSALFFVYPSLYEGFGLPVIEAMSMGCPVGTSNTSSLKEIGKNACLLFNPYNKEEMTQSLVNLSANKQLRQDLIKKGLQRALDFSQEKLAQRLLDVFNTLYDHRS